MIPLNIPWRLIGAVSLVAVVAFCGWRVNTWHESHKALKATEKRLSLEESCGEGSKCRAREAKLREEVEGEKAKVVEGLAQELAAVSGRPPRVIRLCPDRTGVQVPGTAPGSDATTPGTGEFSGSAGRDIGGPVYALAREADEIVARCRQLQNWNRALSK